MKFKANLIQQLTDFGRNLVNEYHSFSPLGKKLTWGGWNRFYWAYRLSNVAGSKGTASSCTATSVS